MNTNASTINNGRWSHFPATYCREEITCIAEIIRNKHSGAVVGGSGTGKSNLGGVLATRPDIIQPLLPDEEYLFCFVDINKFPQKDTIGFYRGMLHALYKTAKRHNMPIAERLYELEREPLQWNDMHTWLYALEEAHELVINQSCKSLVWLLDRFDRACPYLDADAFDLLRGLRDDASFYGKLFYLVFSRKPLQRLQDWSNNSEFLEVIEGNTCWVGPLSESDTRWRVQDLACRHKKKIPHVVETLILKLTGGLAAFVKAASEEWLSLAPHAMGISEDEFQNELLKHKSVQRTCREIIEELEPIERATLHAVAASRSQYVLDPKGIQYLADNKLIRLVEPVGETHPKGKEWVIFSPLLATYILEQSKNGPGLISIDAKQKTLLLDGNPLEISLTKLEYELVEYMIERPNQVLSYDELSSHLWPDDTDGYQDRKGSLQAHIGNVKRKLDSIDLGKTISSIRGHGYQFEPLN